MKLFRTIGQVTAELDTFDGVVQFVEDGWYSVTCEGWRGPFGKGIGSGKWDGQRIVEHTLGEKNWDVLVKEFSDAFCGELMLKIELAKLLEKLPKLGPGYEKRARQALVEEVQILRTQVRP